MSTEPEQVVTEGDQEKVAAADASGAQPIVLVHGLRLLASSWENRAAPPAAAGS